MNALCARRAQQASDATRSTRASLGCSEAPLVRAKCFFAAALAAHNEPCRRHSICSSASSLVTLVSGSHAFSFSSLTAAFNRFTVNLTNQVTLASPLPPTQETTQPSPVCRFDHRCRVWCSDDYHRQEADQASDLGHGMVFFHPRSSISQLLR